jgi:hypothetical protein
MDSALDASDGYLASLMFALAGSFARGSKGLLGH